MKGSEQAEGEHHTTCPNCGAEHSDLMRKMVGRHLRDDVLHPWHRDYEEWQRFKESEESTRNG